MTEQIRPTIFDDYCRYYSDFSKILSLYVKTFHPKVRFEPEQLLDASYNVWHRLNEEEKISLAALIDAIIQNESSWEVPIYSHEIYLKDKSAKLISKMSRRKKKKKKKRVSERWKKMSNRREKRFD